MTPRFETVSSVKSGRFVRSGLYRNGTPTFRNVVIVVIWGA